MRPTLLALILGAGLLLGGCGFKGDLYMPERPTPPAAEPAADDTKPAPANPA